MADVDDKRARRRAIVNRYDAKMRARPVEEIPFPEVKRCCKCGEVKPAAEFYRHGNSKDGLQPRCRVCKSRDHAEKQDQKGRKRRMSAALMGRLGIEMPPPPIEETPDGAIMRVPLGGADCAIIDAADWPLVAGHHWYRIDSGYAVTNASVGDSKRILYMHVLIFGDADAPEVDHRDRDKLNNRRKNLRRASRRLNSANTGRRSDSSAPFKCVRLLPSGRWQARVRVDGRERSLGTYATAEEAARAYDEGARKVFGEFAGVNFGST